MSEEMTKIQKTCPLGAKNGPTRTVRIGNVVIGDGKPVVIAGPCAVESRDQYISSAIAVKAAGAVGLRGGIFKPRTSPYSFQGMAKDGVDLLREAKAATGLFVVVEVLNAEDIDLAEGVADVFQIGARNMQNFSLLKMVGRQKKPVILKRGPSATVMEWLQAAEYILVEGNESVILCERGIRTFETMTRNTLDINGVALIKNFSGLPIFADPSHGTGRRDLILPVARAALAAGADGLIIEVHPKPDEALSDGDQSLDFTGFNAFMKSLALYPPNNSSIHPMTPDFERIQRAREGDSCWTAVSRTIAADLETPVSVYLKCAEGARKFLLESVSAGEQPSRFSYIGWRPLVSLEADDHGVYRTNHCSVREVLAVKDILQALKDEFKGLNVAHRPDLPGFYGGGVGYIGYEYIRRIEQLPVRSEDTLNLPESYWMIPQCLAVFDHVSHEITFVYLLSPHDDPNCAREALDRMEASLAQTIPLPTHNHGDSDGEVHSSFTKEAYESAVKEGIESIRAGEIFQIVLSQRLSRPYGGDAFNLYRVLRRVNPSPYLFFIAHEDFSLIGSSPESMVRLEEGEIHLCPIAGTRPRSREQQEDIEREQELLSDPKERAEHIMLVDLGRNDVGRVAEYGTVHVDDLMYVERYSHVMHIVSSVRARLAPGFDGFDLLRATFPAGTVSGAPKVRAMQLIDELEPVRRGPYAGAVGYIGFSGNLDTGIVIRTITLKDGIAHIQAGAGIVADSIPAKEFDETMHKAEALLRAVNQAEKEGVR